MRVVERKKENMLRLSAFADEIAFDLETQLSVLNSEGIACVEFRSAWGINVLDLSDEQISKALQLFTAHGISVAAIGSPIGKVPIDSSFEQHLQRFQRALTIARAFHTSYIRIFSFYPPAQGSADQPPTSWRESVLERLGEFTRLARAAEITLLHENEKDIYGDTIERNVDLLRSINDRHFRAVLDPANYLQCEQEPYPEAYQAVLPWLAYVHVKDVRKDGMLAVAGEGEARWPDLLRKLRQDGYAGILALEPHLASSGKYQGFSGPDLFRQAVQALKHLLDEMNWKYA